jgi:hypothetical protein
MRFFAFDSFQGLPHSEGDIFFKSQFCSSEHFFRKFVHKAGVDPERIVVVKGFFKNTLTDKLKKKAELKKAAIIHIDCDLYSSTREVLQFIEDVIDIGTIIIFDDWFSFNDDNHKYKRGERAAFTEWESSKLFEVFYEYKTKAFIMIKNR